MPCDFGPQRRHHLGIARFAGRLEQLDRRRKLLGLERPTCGVAVTVKIRRVPLFLGPGPRRDPQRLARQPVIEPLERPRRRRQPGDRSEEHTSELQSLMRSSYAVFCLKQKTRHNPLSNPYPPSYLHYCTSLPSPPSPIATHP